MKPWLTLTAAVSCMLAASGAAIALDDGIAREGAGERRQKLNERELTPFPADLWASLTDWNGRPLTPAEAEGKVVVIVTWASWARASHDALRTAQQLQERYGDQGLIVVGVHHEKGYEHAAKVAEGRGVHFPYAHDASGAFRANLDVDQDPDFYVIDRAGNLRFADIQTSAVADAVRLLIGETPEEAAALPGRLAEKAAQAEAHSRMTRPVESTARRGRNVEVDFTLPDAAVYAAAPWPEKNSGQLYAGDFQGKRLPVELGANETWLTEKPSTKGRIVVLDFWATWCGPCRAAMPGLDALQRAYPDDLVIIGISGSARGQYKEDPASVRQFLRTHKSAYYHANDVRKTINNALQVRGIPHVVVISTDGVIRWQGMPGEPGFRAAVEACIHADPGVKARRAAEARGRG